MHSTTLIALLTLTSTLAAAPAPQELPDVAQLRSQHERALERERALGVERIELGDGRYQLRPPASLQTESVRERGGLYWVYEGQQVFSDLPEESKGGMFYL